jgi:hypothetical protein
MKLISNDSLAVGMSLLAGLLLGCGEQSMRYPVAGKVMIDGEPLSMGSIRFVPDKGRPATSAISSDGTFELTETSLSPNPNQQGVAPGKYRVAVSATKIIDEDADEVEWLAPSKYADFRTSEIEMEINGPQKDLIVDLTWEGNELPEADEDESNPEESTSEDISEEAPVDQLPQEQESPEK